MPIPNDPQPRRRGGYTCPRGCFSETPFSCIHGGAKAYGYGARTAVLELADGTGETFDVDLDDLRAAIRDVTRSMTPRTFSQRVAESAALAREYREIDGMKAFLRRSWWARRAAGGRTNMTFTEHEVLGHVPSSVFSQRFGRWISVHESDFVLA